MEVDSGSNGNKEVKTESNTHQCSHEHNHDHHHEHKEGEECTHEHKEGEHCCIDPEELKKFMKYLCSACHCVLSLSGSNTCANPECKATYCSQCHDDFYEGDQCQQCNTVYKGIPVSQDLEKEMEQLEILCEYEYNGCPERAKYIELKKHEETCEYKEITCVPCDKPLWAEHEFNCVDEKGEITCEHCKWHKEHHECEKKNFLNLFNAADFTKNKLWFDILNDETIAK